MASDLRGELTPDAVIQVCHTLKDNHFYGTFLISDGLKEKCFFFTRGGLRLATANCKAVALEDVMVARGLMDEEGRRRYLSVAEKGDHAPRNLLSNQLNCLPEAIDEQERLLMLGEVLETLLWEDVRYEFNRADPTDGAYQSDLNTRRLSIGIKDLVNKLIEQAPRVRELQSGLAIHTTLFQLTPNGRQALRRGDDVPLDVMRAVERGAPINFADLSDRLPRWQEYELAWTLHALVQKNNVSSAGRQGKSPEGRLDRIRRMEEALEAAVAPILRRQALARGYEEQRDNGAAAKHYKRAGLLLLKDQRADEAIDDLRSAFGLQPEDFEAHEGLIDALWGAKKADDAQVESAALSQRYFDLGLVNRARLVLERSAQAPACSLDLKLMLVRAYLRLGNSERALDLGKSVCEELRQAGRTEEALALARRFVEAGVDRSRVLEMAGESGRRTVRLVLYAVCALLVLLLYPSTELARAKQAFAVATEQARRHVVDGEYAKAKSTLQTVAANHTWGGIERQSRAYLREIGELESEREEFLTVLRPWVVDEQVQWGRGPSPKKALQTIYELRDKSRKQDRPEVFRLTCDVLEESLRKYGDEAEAIRRQFREACRSQDYARANDLAKNYFQNFKNVEEVRSTFVARGVPVKLRTNPPGATVSGLRNKVKTDCVAYVPPTPTEVVFTKEGYKPLRVRIDSIALPFELPVYELVKNGGGK